MTRIDIGPVPLPLKTQAEEAAEADSRSLAYSVRRWIDAGSQIDIAAPSYLGRVPTVDEIVGAVVAWMERGGKA